MQLIAEEATDLVRSFGGSLSGEHGDGRLRTHLLERYYGREICGAFAAIKRIFDPDGRLNPGNIVGIPAMTERLRVEPEEHPVDIRPMPTYFRYEREGGFGKAIEQCNGAGVCRKTSGGTMCPSYRVTRDERHATRGRGNALRLAMTGQILPDTATPVWDDHETLETLDLCLGCKACAAECPSNVDVAKLKAEYLAQSYDQRGCVPLPARVFAHVRTLNRIAAIAPVLSNWIGRRRMTKALLQRVLRVDARRSLPAFGRSPIPWARRWMRRRARDVPAVLLFGDCFSTYNEPDIFRSAARTLDALGYRVVPVAPGCCGRSMISLGRLDRATETIARTARGLIDAVHDHQAIAIIGLEPSCVSAIVDDWVDLDVPRPREDMRMLARLTTSIEVFIEERWSSHPSPVPSIPSRGERAVVHPHCHQRAVWGTGALRSVLIRCGYDVEELDAGCCGMAGSFGMLAEHYDVSMAIAEQSLLPAVRARYDTLVSASGTSCRHQIRDGAGRHALHPIELIEAALVNRSRG